jgi:hypothetical protein
VNLSSAAEQDSTRALSRTFGACEKGTKELKLLFGEPNDLAMAVEGEPFSSKSYAKFGNSHRKVSVEDDASESHTFDCLFSVEDEV